MAQEYDNTNTIAIFKADKGDNPKRPDYSGNLNCEGTEYKVSLWMRESKTGTKFLSGQIQPKEEPKNKSSKAQSIDEFKDDLPF